MVPFFLQSEIRIVSHEFCRIIPTVFKITRYSLRDGNLLEKNWGYCNEDCPSSTNPRYNITDDLASGNVKIATRNQSVYFSDHFSGCHTHMFEKFNRDVAYGVYLKGTYDFSQAEERCKKFGAQLPEIQSEVENVIISKLWVIRSVN